MVEYIVKQQKFVLPRRYVPIQKLGSGSYGLVISAKDGEKGEEVAIKRCGNVFKHCEDGKRVLREIKMMSMLNHRNVLSIKDVFVSETNFQDVYVVTPCLHTDLAQLIKSYTLSEQHIKYLMYQILRGLRYVHSANMLHRDLKPANILVNYDCHAKLCDFGLARGYDPTNQQEMTSYIVTRWYRAPELLLNTTKYSGAIDIWAVGCIFAEMLLGKPLFSGDSSLEQLRLICDTIPVPDAKELWWVPSSKLRTILLTSRPVAGKDLRSLLGNKASPEAMEMLEKMLNFNPFQRWSAEHLLEHPYLADIRSGRHHEPATHRFKWKWDSVTNLTEPVLRRLFWEELVRFHPECKFAPPGTKPATPVAIEAKRTKDQNEKKDTRTTVSLHKLPA